MSAPNNEDSLELTFSLVKFNFKQLPEILEAMIHSPTLGLLISIGKHSCMREKH